jgi:hypothetical protein
MSLEILSPIEEKKYRSGIIVFKPKKEKANTDCNGTGKKE